MARKKNLPGGVPVPGGLFDPQRAKAAAPHPGPLPDEREEKISVMEFRGAEGRQWRIERWEEFVAEMQMPEFRPRAREWEAGLPALQAALSQPGNERTWLVMRRLFGFMPVRVGLNEDPEQWRVWTPAELCQNLGLNAEQFQQELRALRVGVAKVIGIGERIGDLGSGIENRKSTHEDFSGVLIDTDSDLLTKYGYSASMFDAVVAFRVTEDGKDRWDYRPREKEENAAEMKWFCGRLRDMEKLMVISNAMQHARSALMHELRMRRAQTDLFRYCAGTPEYERARAEYDKAEVSHRGAIEQINEVAPWFNVGGKEAGLTASMGDIVKAIQQWNARKETKLLDGLFTAAGIQVQLRTSKQFEDPRYRIGWNLYVMDSRAGIWDPNWKSRFSERDLKKLDRGFQDGVLAVMEEEGEEPIDLLKDEYAELGPESYPDGARREKALGKGATENDQDEASEENEERANEDEPEDASGEKDAGEKGT